MEKAFPGTCRLAHTGELTGVFCSLVCLLIFGAERFIIPSMILILAVLSAGRKRIEPAADELQKGEKA